MFRERQQIIICALAGAMVCGFVLFRYLPLRKSKKAVEQSGVEQMLVITKTSAESKRMPEVKQQLQELQQSVGNYEHKIPEHRELGMFLQKITNLMNEQNLVEQVIQPSQEIEADALKCIPVNMQCKGRLTQIFEFYKRLQGLDRLVRIEQIRLTNDSDFSGEVSMETKAIIYYRTKAGQG